MYTRSSYTTRSSFTTGAESTTQQGQQQAGVMTCSDCNEKAEKDVLCCGKCKNLTHYSCSMLPDYIIFQLVKKKEKKNKDKYTCAECMGQVSPQIARHGIDTSVGYLIRKVEHNRKGMEHNYDSLQTEYSVLEDKYTKMLMVNQKTITKLAEQKAQLTEYLSEEQQQGKEQGKEQKQQQQKTTRR